jgi:glutamate-1-semialdehyde 2,1-aminomutase
MNLPLITDLAQGTGQQLYRKAKTMIPGGTQLFGKRQENFAPEQWPTYFAEAKGAEVVDLDGLRYIDMCTCGIGATVLGYADPDVTKAVIERISRGAMCMLNPPEEVELAELLLQIHPWAEKVRFGRVGGETMAIAVRIARAGTGREKIAFCGYHGWHDWYLSANMSTEGKGMVDRLGNWHNQPGLEPAGIPQSLAGTSLPFTYNKIDELKAIVDRHGSELAAIVMEPTRNLFPEPGFLEGVRELADRCGARLIFDEITISWKLCLGGAHLKYGVQPDMAVFAKTLGNGHPISAVIGTADTMEAAQDTFISSAMWTEAVGPAAGVATVKKLMRIDVPAHLEQIGGRVRDGLAEIAQRHDVPLNFTGYPALMYFHFDHPQTAALQTLWTVRMLSHGFLASGGFYPMLAHEDQHVDAYLAACDSVFEEMSQALKQDDIENRIGGPVKHSGFQRLA